VNRFLARVVLVLAASTPLALAQPSPSAAPAPASGMTQLTWYGQSAFRIVTPGGKVLLVDPWISNPLNLTAAADLAALKRVDLILITHGHSDHVGDTVAIAEKTKARLVTTADQADAMVRYLGFPTGQRSIDSVGNVGGTLSFFDGEVKVTMVPAVHSSAVKVTEGKGEVAYPSGNPIGFVIAIRNGPTLYHTGDTDLFGDMQFLRPMKVTLMLVCIGDHFTMGPARAAEAVALVQPTRVSPMHYGTFPALTGTPAEFAAALKAKVLLERYQPLQLHETLEL
jgi:L-ascorbate metabolism protein UlaG (beta-lactamase superfamily)